MSLISVHCTSHHRALSRHTDSHRPLHLPCPRPAFLMPLHLRPTRHAGFSSPTPRTHTALATHPTHVHTPAPPPPPLTRRELRIIVLALRAACPRGMSSPKLRTHILKTSDGRVQNAIGWLTTRDSLPRVGCKEASQAQGWLMRRCPRTPR